MLPLLAIYGQLEWADIWPILGGGLVIALIGWLDDLSHVAVRWRLLGHFAAAGWILFWVGGFPPVTAFGVVIELGGFGYLLGSLYIVWLLNLFNFMDGIDAIAGVESITVCIGAAALGVLSGNGVGVVMPLLLASATLGFLVWNFPPAKIFMGDVGSCFVGIALAAMSLQAAWYSPAFLWSWLILLGVFIVDTSWTLLRRLLQGQRVHEAHRTHAYQYSARWAGSHRPISLAVGAINLFWLLPIAIWVGVGGLGGIEGVVLAYLPLLLLAIKFNAGTPEPCDLRTETSE
ncbi:MraY family glycosyltransferase [Aestuariirhabdus sp. LZHN29]|uniref:MraY family glycosyltransferase n=1 Tax=Aestuariirhabdus sp. LZHN29 TaxID=3417462 RepID=UPI003CEC1239